MNNFSGTINGFTFQNTDKVKADLGQLANVILDLYKWEKSMRKKLETLPQGFKFPASNMTCNVCLGETFSEMWYDQLGMRCVDCQRAYQKKVIPKYIVQGNRNGAYITETYLSSKTGLKSEQIKKRVSTGELKARIIVHHKKPDTWLFLKNENPLIAKYFV